MKAIKNKKRENAENVMIFFGKLKYLLYLCINKI